MAGYDPRFVMPCGCVPGKHCRLHHSAPALLKALKNLCDAKRPQDQDWWRANALIRRIEEGR